MLPKGFIIFHGQGDYQITPAGFEELNLLPIASGYDQLWEALKDKDSLAY